MWKTVFERKQMKSVFFVFFWFPKKGAKKKKGLGLKGKKKKRRKRIDWIEGLQMSSCLRSLFQSKRLLCLGTVVSSRHL